MTRRRWIAVVALALVVPVVFLLLVIGVAGPQARIDPRLIGKWTVTSGPPLNMTETFTFNANGTSIEEQVIPIQPAPFKSAGMRFWSVEGDVLRFQSDDPNSIPIRTVRGLMSLRARVLGVSPELPAEDTWEIVEVTDDTLRLKYTGERRWPQPEYELIRVVK